ncbi:hypothetical protein GCM10010169_04510 [Micromonospora fulviviridis]|uniref:hypothetical protein n=1 Tax=Micromonospora fulviviridis TaxID=47860 RepID=UPI0016686021|nr:hypothetical protein [Micromonospora fulviviridis]GGR64583.1 hypothetical protein GCM10010169_04510 [Micromonospora fulviviridis]
MTRFARPARFTSVLLVAVHAAMRRVLQLGLSVRKRRTPHTATVTRPDPTAGTDPGVGRSEGRAS